jgi:signal transduction histidine kinase
MAARHSPGGDLAEITVKDTGYGIPAAEKNLVFTKFFRGSNVLEKEPQGTGLGLYLTRAVLERMGGKISFISREGKGTTFKVTLPRSGVKPHPGIKGLLPMA